MFISLFIPNSLKSYRYLAVKALVIIVALARVLVTGDDGDHLVPAQLLPDTFLLTVRMRVMPLYSIQILGSFWTVATHVAS